jgi:hypothetical protein
VDMMDKSCDLPTYPQAQPLQQNYIRPSAKGRNLV